MNLERSRLGSKSQEFTDVINLKLDKDESPELLKSEGYYPAYHMNKKYWITITLDETVKDSDIMKLIEESHSYTLSKSKKHSK
jgi:predicted DNA-binding protein (MmcQ/YjbR family)